MIVTDHAIQRFIERVFQLQYKEVTEMQKQVAGEMIRSQLKYQEVFINGLVDCKVTLEDYDDFMAVIRSKKVLTITEKNKG